MYPSQRSLGQGTLNRYASAPGSFLRSVVDSVIDGDEEFSNGDGSDSLMNRYFSGDSSSLTSESSCKAANVSSDLKERSYSLNEFDNGGSSSSLIRHSSSPAGFFNHLTVSNGRVVNSELERSYAPNEISGVRDSARVGNIRSGGSSPLIRQSSSPAGLFNNHGVDNGFSVTRGIGSYSQASSNGGNGIPNARLKSQLSFTRQESLSQISEVDENVLGDGDPGTYASDSFPIGSWDTKAIVFSAPPSKRAKNINGEIVASLSNMESQFNLPATSLEMATMGKLLQVRQDSIPCKSRAKRGCATHPRSIAERERRTRISGKLKKLFEFIPNMDKQTSNAEMLDLALEHIKGLQSQVEKLKKDIKNCSCGCSQVN